GGRLIYHEHDSPSPVAEPGASWFARVVRRARIAVARSADLSILPNARRAAIYRETTGCDRTLTVWNTPSLDEARPLPVRAGLDLRLLYHGSIVPSRLPLAAVDALARLPDGVSVSV